MEEEDQKELQLLPTPLSIASSSHIRSSDSSLKYRSTTTTSMNSDHHQYEGPSLDLQLSISLRPIQKPSNCVIAGPICDFGDVKADTGCVESLKWQAAEQIRLAAIEKAYAERVRELTKREMELAQSEFARARHMWQRAREEVEKAERLKERATRQIDSTCMEITCQSCRQRFRP
ncbi:putative nucleic acid binding protein [Corchorus capsularis]|uniref:Putative nucleic acid binding protein n=1 Tax=Corchorus capsularis TaxID=210143 RepID=A0A1R3IND3_COCAP|nr:putative nucleic acid binding protein [Corchorus capsularis]